MTTKMLPVRHLAAAVSIVLLGWIGWNAVQFLPQAWSSYREGQRDGNAPSIDTTLFQSDSAISSDTSALSQDTSLTGLLSRLQPDLGIARRSIGTVQSNGASIPLYSLVLRRGAPLPELAARAIDSLEAHGFEIAGSTENPRGAWPWMCHLSLAGRPVAVVRAKIDAAPAPGSFELGLVLWADSLDAGTIASIPLLPRGTVLALPPKPLAEARVLSMAKTAGLRIALLCRLETTRFPVRRQEERRILLHHQDEDLKDRLHVPSALELAPEGVVVIDGDRGASDPALTARLARHCKARDLWILDATGVQTSLLVEAAKEAGATALPPVKPMDGRSLEEALEESSARAEHAGVSSLVWPLDSTSVARIGSNLPLLEARGIGIRPPTPPKEHEGE